MEGAEVPIGCSCGAPIRAEGRGLLQNKEGKVSVQLVLASVWGRPEVQKVCCFQGDCFHPLVCVKPDWENWKPAPHSELLGFHNLVLIMDSPLVLL